MANSKSTLLAPSVLDSLRPILGGAVAAMLVLAIFRFGANEVWSPFARSGPRIFLVLTISALAGGLAATVLSRRFSAPLAATSCALGWALSGLWLHFGAQGRYLQIIEGGFPVEATAILLFKNAISQSIAIAFALLLASGVSWLWARRQHLVAEEVLVTDDDLDGNGLKSFSTAVVYPIATLFGGVIMLNIFGLLITPLGDPPVGQLPSGPGVAALCGLLTMAALFIATLAARRAFSALGNIGDVVIAPLVIAFVAIFSQLPFMRSAALLIWHTSAFELANWGVLGASLGYYFARASRKKI